MNFTELPGVISKTFCSISVERTEDTQTQCINEAVGELTMITESGIEVPMPICQAHLDEIQRLRELDRME